MHDAFHSDSFVFSILTQKKVIGIAYGAAWDDSDSKRRPVQPMFRELKELNFFILELAKMVEVDYYIKWISTQEK